MRLLYWYTRFLDENGNPRKYHGLYDFELNLSTDTKYHFDVNTYEFTQEPYKTPLPENFWGDKLLYNINAVVGNNGTGKTTVIHTVMDTLQEVYDREIKRFDETVFLAMVEQGGLALFHLTGSRTNLPEMVYRIPNIIQKPRKIDSENNITKCLLERTDSAKLIYITNTLSEIDDNRYHSTHKQPHVRANYIYDCSLSSAIRYDSRDDWYNDTDKELIDKNSSANTQQDQMRSFFINEYYKQVKFVFDKTQRKLLYHLKEEKNLSVPIPEKLSITIRSYNEKYKGLLNLSEGVIAQNTPSEKLAYCLCVSCFYTFLDNIGLYGISPPEKSAAPESVTYEEFKKLFKTAHLENTVYIREDYIYSKCLDFIEYVCRTKETFDCFDYSQSDFDVFSEGYSINFSLPVNAEKNNWMLDFMHYYRLTCSPFYFLDFSWGLSSGENNLLRLFSSIYYAFDYGDSNLYNWSNMERRTQCNSVIILMDEADLTYHPEWQRQLIQILAAFLPLEFGNCGIDDLQVILTTHSPLLLGDIPSNNVTYLRQGDRNINDNNLNSFGQNIHNILKDSFFLESTIGAFATDKINKTAKKLRDMRDKGNLTQNELRECKAIIDLLAPGVIKSKLIELYEETTAKRVDKKKSIMEQYIKELSSDELENLFDVLYEEKKRRDNDKN